MKKIKKDSLIKYLGRKDTVLAFTLNTIFDGVYIVDKERRIVFWNKGAEEITGYSSGEVCDRKCSDNILNHIDENGNLLCTGPCPLSYTLKTGKRRKVKVYPLHKTGRRFPVMTHVAPIKDKDGSIIAAIEVFRDISEEERFRILQEKFNNLIKKYVSSATFKGVMKQVRSDKKIISRRRDLTILYLDIVGFTPFAEKHSHDQVVNLLNDVFGICEVITKECHGDIDKFVGDAIMAVFVDANDAIDAAAKILGAFSRMNAAKTKKKGEAVSVRIGINSGNVIQGDIGTTERKDLTVIGDVVNTASRIQSVADPNSIFISEATSSRLNEYNWKLFKPYRKILLKGKKKSVQIFKHIKSKSK